eukprot:g12816.t1
MEFELYYWGGNFAGRGEYVRLALHLAGVTWRDVGREEGSGKVVEYIRSKQPNGTYPVCFPPILKHNKDGKEIVINQLPAVLLYLGKLYGFMPEPDNALSYARVMQISLTALDALSGAEHAYHPVNPRDAYANQVKEAEKTVAIFLENRLPVFLDMLEKALLMNGGGKGYFVDDKMTIADLVVYNFMRGYRSSQKDHYAQNQSIPTIKQFVNRMDKDEKIDAFLKSDKCTKMENPENTPLSKAPLVQVNSFM